MFIDEVKTSIPVCRKQLKTSCKVFVLAGLRGLLLSIVALNQAHIGLRFAIGIGL